MSSAEFYDNFIASQVKSGINDRIFGLYKRLCGYGLETHTSVFEVGCGIGTLTWLLLKKVHPENIEAIDISPKSIEFAQKHLNNPRLKLAAADIASYQPASSSFDRILFFDVLEHIPISQHPEIFQKISKWMHEDSFLLINIPNPGYILYDQKNNPATLQETDQPVFLEPLVKALGAASLDIIKMETWSVWAEEDYQFFVIRKCREFQENLLSNKRNILQKGITWWKRKWRKIRYPFP